MTILAEVGAKAIIAISRSSCNSKNSEWNIRMPETAEVVEYGDNG
jgi:uncharacterized protein YicC (UPF0701 family)